LQYRYLDLRRAPFAAHPHPAPSAEQVIRDSLDAQGFLEIETPLLGKSTPEGARDYLVPTASFPASGSRCAIAAALQAAPHGRRLRQVFSDRPLPARRDLRANRQPEFTQLDLEMSFVDMDNLQVIETLVADIFRSASA